MERWCIVFAWSSFDSRLSSCSSWMTVGMQRSTCSPGRESMLEQVDAWEETVTLWEAKIGGGSWQDLQTQGERSPGWTRFPDRTCHSLGDACWSRLSWRTVPYGRVTPLQQFMESSCLWDGLTLEKFMDNYLLWEGSHIEAGGRPFSLGSSRNNDHKPHQSSVSLGHCRGGGRVGKEVGGGWSFEYLFYFSLSCSAFDIKFVNFFSLILKYSCGTMYLAWPFLKLGPVF